MTEKKEMRFSRLEESSNGKRFMVKGKRFAKTDSQIFSQNRSPLTVHPLPILIRPPNKQELQRNSYPPKYLGDFKEFFFFREHINMNGKKRN